MDWDYEIVVIPCCLKCAMKKELVQFSLGGLMDRKEFKCAFCGKQESDMMICIKDPKYWVEEQR